MQGMWWERTRIWCCFQSQTPSQLLSPVQPTVLPGPSVPWLLPGPVSSPAARLLPVAWHLLLPATITVGLPTLHLGWWQQEQAEVRYTFWYLSPLSLTARLFLLNLNTKHQMIGPPLSHSCLLLCLFLTEDTTACADSSPQYMAYLSESPMARKIYWLICFQYFTYISQLVIQQPYALVLTIKLLYSITAHQQMPWDLNNRESYAALAKLSRNIQPVLLLVFSSSTSLAWLLLC